MTTRHFHMGEIMNTHENLAQVIEARTAFENKYGVVGSLLASGNYSSWVHQAKWEAFFDGWILREAELVALNYESPYQMQKPTITDDQLEVEKLLQLLDDFWNEKWGVWKSTADMVAQGEANAYEHVRGLLETAIKQDEATCQWLRNQLANVKDEFNEFAVLVNEQLICHESLTHVVESKIQKIHKLLEGER